MEGIAILHQFPFSSGLQRMSVVSKKIGEEQYDVYMKGAPEIVSSFCRPETGTELGKGNFTALQHLFGLNPNQSLCWGFNPKRFAVFTLPTGHTATPCV